MVQKKTQVTNKNKKKHIIVAGIVTVTLITAATLYANFYYIPKTEFDEQYETALQQMEDKEFALANDTVTKLLEDPWSESKMYSLVEAMNVSINTELSHAIETDSYEELSSLYTIVKTSCLDDTAIEEIRISIADAILTKVTTLLENDQPEKGYNWVRVLGRQDDFEEQYKEANYQLALYYYNTDEYQEAGTLFIKDLDYKNSEAYYTRCLTPVTVTSHKMELTLTNGASYEDLQAGINPYSEYELTASVKNAWNMPQNCTITMNVYSYQGAIIKTYQKTVYLEALAEYDYIETYRTNESVDCDKFEVSVKLN